MTTDDRCTLTDLPRTMCAHCHPDTDWQPPVLGIHHIPADHRDRYQPIRLTPDSSRIWAWNATGPGHLQPVNCDHPHDDGRPMCSACVTEIEHALADVPALVDDLEIQIRRDSRFVQHGTRPGDGTESALPIDTRASLALHRLTQAVADWTSRPNPAAASRWALANMPVLLRHPRVADCAYALTRAVIGAHWAIERPRDMTYAGTCSCGADLWAERTSTSVTCNICGLSYVIADLHQAAVNAAHDQLLTLDQLVGAVTMAGQPVDRDTIRAWIERDGIPREQRITPYWRNGELQHDRSVWVYRLGDVLERARLAELEASALTSAEVAQKLRVSPAYVRVLAERGELPPVRPGAKPLRFTWEALTAYQQRRGA